MPDFDDVSQRVSRSYDEIGEAYTAQRLGLATAGRYVDMLAGLLSPNAVVLDVGCGAGVPADRLLLEAGMRVTGIDISPKQIEQARRLNPDGAYAVRDMLDLKPGEYQVDAVLALYSIFHVPRERHAGVLSMIRSYLSSGGLLLATMGGREDEGWDDFFGADMYWSHYGPDRNRLLVQQAGFAIKLDELDVSGDERHQVLLAKAF